LKLKFGIKNRILSLQQSGKQFSGISGSLKDNRMENRESV